MTRPGRRRRGPEPGEPLARALGPVDATCIVVGAIVGVGIFFTPSDVAALSGSGPMALLAWTAGGAIALLGALTFAELGGLYPRAGGQYDALRDAWGPMPAFLFVFCNATAIQAGASAIIAVICAQNLAIAAGGAADSPGLPVLAVLLILGLVGANIAGVRFGAGIQTATAFAKVATLLLVTALAAALGTAEIGGAEPADRPPGLGAVGGIFAALVPALFTFGGWQQALWMAGEVRRPRRDVPLAIIAGVLVVIAVYLLINWAYLRLLGHEGVAASDAIAADAVAAVWPGAGRRLAAAAVAVSAFGVLNAQLLTGPRLVYGMARDGRFFPLFARTSARFRTPVPAIALIGILALALLLGAGRDLDALLAWVVVIDGLFFALTAAALPVLRRRRPEAPRPVRVPGYPVVPLLFVAGEGAVVLGAALDPAVRAVLVVAAVWILGAAACYLLFFRGPAGGRPDGPGDPRRP